MSTPAAAAAATAATAAVERFLAHFHDRAPGGSPRAFAPLVVVDAQGRRHASSYDALVQAVVEAVTQGPAQAPVQATGEPAPAPGAVPDPGPVLDLACGDGHLLQRLRAALPGLPLLGADFSRGELAAARRRGLADATLLQARAQALPLPGATLAALTSHMALMLMSPAEAVLAEIARVLRPGGWLLAVLPRPPEGELQPPAVYRAFQQATQGMAPDPRWAEVRFQGRRWCQPAQLQPLLQAAGFTAVQWQPLSATLRLDGPGAWDWIREMYDIRLLGDAVDEAIRPRFLAALAQLMDADGRCDLPHRLWLLQARRAPGP